MTPSTDTRTALIEAFADALAATSYPGVSLSEVAATVGIKKPSLYHHFPGGKEALYAAVAARFTEETGARVTAALASSDELVEQLRALADACRPSAPAAVSFEQRIYDALEHVPEAQREQINAAYVSEVLDPAFALFAAAVERGDLTGEPRFLAMTYLELVRGTSDVDAALALFLDGARPRV